MNRTAFVVLAIGLISLGAPVQAFQEQAVGGAAQTAPAPGIVIDNSTPTNSVDADFSAPPSSAAGSKGGAEVFIPGLGSLGVLPKLDFGLELLYGATETARPEPGNTGEDDDDLILRGRIKHNF